MSDISILSTKPLPLRPPVSRRLRDLLLPYKIKKKKHHVNKPRRMAFHSQHRLNRWSVSCVVHVIMKWPAQCSKQDSKSNNLTRASTASAFIRPTWRAGSRDGNFFLCLRNGRPCLAHWEFLSCEGRSADADADVLCKHDCWVTNSLYGLFSFKRNTWVCVIW